MFERKLIACVNYFPIQAALHWQGEFTTEHECVALYKTIAAKYADIEKLIYELHPYDVPCIIQLPVTANQAYEDWVAAEVAQ